MVASLGDDELTAMVRHHHERFDGTGYPNGLAGEAIPIGARVIAVADTFDAVTSTRPYRPAHAHKKAIDILTAEAGAQLDPDAVRAFLSCYAGRRSLALWTFLTNGPPRLASWLGGGLSPASAASAAGVVATAAATAVVGGGALAPLVEAPTRSHVAAVAPAALQVALPSRTGEGGSLVGARGQGRGDRNAATVAPRVRRGKSKRDRATDATPRGGARARGKGKRGAEKTAPGRGRGQGKAKGRPGERGQGNPSAPGRPATPGEARTPPAAGNGRPDGEAPAGNAGGTGGGRPPANPPLPAILDDVPGKPAPTVPERPGAGDPKGTGRGE